SYDIREYLTFGHDEVQSLFAGPDGYRAGDEHTIDEIVLATDKYKTVSFLFGGFGDGRRVYATIIQFAEMWKTLRVERDAVRSKFQLPNLHLTLFDIHPASVARVMLMFALVRKVMAAQDPTYRLEVEAAAFYAWNTLHMPTYCADIIVSVTQQVIRELTGKSPPELTKLYTLAEASKAPVLKVLRYWESKPFHDQKHMVAFFYANGPQEHSSWLSLSHNRIKETKDYHKKMVKVTSRVHKLYDKGVNGLTKDPLLPLYNDFDAEDALFQKARILLPPKDLLNRHPALERYVQSGGGKGLGALKKEILRDWKPNATLFDNYSSASPIYTPGGYPKISFDEDPSHTTCNILSFLCTQRGPDDLSLDQTSFMAVRQMFDSVAKSFELLDPQEGALTLEFVCSDVCSGVPKLLAGDLGYRPESFPKKYLRMWLSNVPDYTGGVLSNLVYLVPYLESSSRAMMTWNCLLNSPCFDTRKDWIFNYAYLNASGIRRFFNCLFRDENREPAGRFSLSALERTSLYSDVVSKSELHNYLSSLLLRAICCPRSEPRPEPFSKPYPVHEPTNLINFFRLLVALVKTFGCPAHWVGDYVQNMINDDLKTTASLFDGLIPITQMPARKALERKLNLIPYQLEIENVLVSAKGAFPFSMSYPSRFAASYKSIKTYVANVKVAVNIYEINPFTSVASLLFYKAKADHRPSLRDLPSLIPRLIESTDGTVDGIQMQIVSGMGRMDLENNDVVSWEMSEDWDRKMKDEKWSMIIWVTDRRRTGNRESANLTSQCRESVCLGEMLYEIFYLKANVLIHYIYQAFKLDPKEPKYSSNLSAVFYEQGRYTQCIGSIIDSWRALCAQCSDGDNQPNTLSITNPLATKLSLRYLKAKFNSIAGNLPTNAKNGKITEIEQDILSFCEAVAQASSTEIPQVAELRHAWKTWQTLATDSNRQTSEDRKTSRAAAEKRLRDLPIFRSTLYDVMEYITFGHDQIDSLFAGMDQANQIDDELNMTSLTLLEEKWKSIPLLFGGFGDGRQVFATMIHFAAMRKLLTGLELRVKGFQLPNLHLTLFDIHPAVVARLMLMFALIRKGMAARDATYRLEVEATMFYAWNTLHMPAYCANIVMSVAHDVIQELTDKSPRNLTRLWTIDARTRARVLEEFQYWSKPLMKDMRTFFYTNGPRGGLTELLLPQTRYAQTKEDYQKTVQALQQTRTRVDGLVKDPTLPLYNNFDGEDALFQKARILLPPKEFLSRHPALEKYVKSNGRQGVKTLIEEVINEWKPNPTLFDHYASESSAILVGGYPRVSFDEDPSHTTVNILGNVFLHRGPEELSMDETSFVAVRQLFDSVKKCFELLDPHDGALNLEFICSDVYSGLSKLHAGDFGPRPPTFPKKYLRMWLSNVPDYTGGILGNIIYLAPYLENSRRAMMKWNCLLNAPVFQTQKDWSISYSYLPASGIRRFFSCLLRDEDQPSFELFSLSVLRRTTPFSSVVSKKELHEYLSSILLRAMCCPRGVATAFPLVHEPTNLISFFRLLIALVETFGCPAHWVGDYVQNMIKDSVTTTASLFDGILPITQVPPPRETERKINLVPYQLEMETVLVSAKGALPFSLMYPSSFVSSCESIKTYAARVRVVVNLMADNISPSFCTANLLFYKEGPSQSTSVGRDLPSRIPELVESKDGKVDGMQVQIVSGVEQTDLEKTNVVSWKMSEQWDRKMKEEGWSMIVWVTNRRKAEFTALSQTFASIHHFTATRLYLRLAHMADNSYQEGNRLIALCESQSCKCAHKLDSSEPKYPSNLSAVYYEQGCYTLCIGEIVRSWRALRVKHSINGKPGTPPFTDPIANKLALRFLKAKLNSNAVDPQVKTANKPKNSTASAEIENDIVSYCHAIAEIKEGTSNSPDYRLVWETWRQWEQQTIEKITKRREEGGRRLRELPVFRSSLYNVIQYFKFGHDNMQSLFTGSNGYKHGDEFFINEVTLMEEKWNTISLLLGGFGDGRHVYATMIHFADMWKTLSEFDLKRAAFQFPKLHLTLFDIHPAAVARVMLIFALIRKGMGASDETNRLEMEATTFYIWNALHIPAYCADIVMSVSQEIIDELTGKSPRVLTKLWTVDEQTKTRVVTMFRYWSKPLQKDMDTFYAINGPNEFGGFGPFSITDTRINLTKDEYHNIVSGVQQVHSRVNGVAKDPDLPTYNDLAAEDKLFQTTRILLPPKEFLSRHPALEKYVKSGGRKGKAALKQEIVKEWKPNTVLFDNYTAESSAYAHGGYPKVSFDEDPSHTTVNILGFLCLHRGPDELSVDQTSFMVIRQMFDSVKRCFEVFDSRKDALNLEFVCADLYSGLPKLLAGDMGPRPSTFPKKYLRMWLSNTPDYTGGILSNLVYLAPYLEDSKFAMMTWNCLLNTSSFETLKENSFNYSYLTASGIRRFFSCLYRDEDKTNFESACLSIVPRTALFSNDVSKKELHDYLSAILLRALCCPRSGRLPYQVDEPTNLINFFRLTIALVQTFGCPAHWVGDYVQNMIKDNLMTTASLFDGILPVKQMPAPKKTERKLNLAPYQLEMENVFALAKGAFPFFLSYPDQFAASHEAIKTYTTNIQVVANLSGGETGDIGPTFRTASLLFYKAGPNHSSSALRELPSRIPELVESKDGKVDGIEVQIVSGADQMDLENSTAVSWKMSEEWDRKMKQEEWSMIVWVTNRRKTISAPVSASAWKEKVPV
ncbi:hypothetical protein CVT24_013372, partial [Panaeolus cyanescens]